MTDEIQHHQLNGHEFEQSPRDNERQESLACCSPWGCKELDKIQPLNNNSYRREGSNKTATASEQSTFRVKAEGKRESSSEIKKGFFQKKIRCPDPGPVDLVLKRQKGNMYFKNLQWAGTSLVVQWTRICMPTISSIPGLGRLHMPQATKARAPQILSLCSSAHKPQLMSPCATTTEAHTPRACAQQQKPAHCKPRAAPTHCNQRKPTRSKEDPGKPKIKKNFFFNLLGLVQQSEYK